MASAQKLRVPLTKTTVHTRSGPKSYKRVLAKYNSKLAAPVGAAATSSGQVPATDIEGNAEYLVKVEIGTPAQTLNLDFDTGSSDLWVWSTNLPSNVRTQYGKDHTIFDPSKSSSFQQSSGSTWQISYGDGSSSSGPVGTDTVAIGSISIQAQAVELAGTLSTAFEQGQGDGLLGLAWPSINTAKPKPVATPVENMINENLLPTGSQLFTCWLGSAASTASAANSWYTFGDIDTEALTEVGASASSIHYTPVDNSNGFWQFGSTSAKVNDQTITLSGNTAIADTGTTLALVSDELAAAVYKAIPGSKNDAQQGGYVFPTNTAAASLPTIQVDVGGQLFTINNDELAFADAGSGMSFGAIQSRGQMTFDILGDVFLRSVYAIFDHGNKRFGVVARPATTSASKTSS